MTIRLLTAALALAPSLLLAQPPQGAERPGQGQPAPSHPSITLPAPLDRVLRDYERAWGARDARALAALFAADGWVAQAGRPAATGRAEIERSYQGHGGPLALRAWAYAADDTVGWIIGAYSDSAGRPDMGKFVLALRRANPSSPWLIAVDIDNMNRRPMMGPPPGAQGRPPR